MVIKPKMANMYARERSGNGETRWLWFWSEVRFSVAKKKEQSCLGALVILLTGG
jgi:hypothetical protein